MRAIASLTARSEGFGLRAIKIVFTIAVAISVGLAAGALIAAFFATQFLSYRVLTVQSESMSPSLRRGDVIVVRPVSTSGVNAGDSVVFERGSGRMEIVHRVTAVVRIISNFTDADTGAVTTSISHRLQTQGDSSELPDWNLVDDSNLVGKVWFSIPRIGIGVFGLPLQEALLILALLIGVAWVAWEFRGRPRARS